jgi:hypothetical protein
MLLVVLVLVGAWTLVAFLGFGLFAAARRGDDELAAAYRAAAKAEPAPTAMQSVERLLARGA